MFSGACLILLYKNVQSNRLDFLAKHTKKLNIVQVAKQKIKQRLCYVKLGGFFRTAITKLKDIIVSLEKAHSYRKNCKYELWSILLQFSLGLSL